METIDKIDIEARLSDWRKRIDDLYTQIEIWLRNDEQYRFERSTPVSLGEEMMDKFGIGKVQFPTANIYRSNNLLASLKPKGLWVIGANGRVDLISKSKLIMLLDFSEQFQPSKWQITYSTNRQKRISLNKDNLIEVLRTL